MSNFQDEMIQREMYKALYPPKKIKNMREKAIDFLRKNKILGASAQTWEIRFNDESRPPVDLVDLFVTFAQTIQGGLNWVPTDQEKPENLQWCLVCVKNNQSGEKHLSIAMYTNGYGLETDAIGVYHEEDDEYYCPEGFYEFDSTDAETMWRINPEDKTVTHFIPRDFIPLP